MKEGKALYMSCMILEILRAIPLSAKMEIHRHFQSLYKGTEDQPFSWEGIPHVGLLEDATAQS